MRWTGWSVARTRARPALTVALLGLVAVAASVLGGLAGLTDALASAAAQEALAGEPATAITVRARAGADIDAQDRVAREAISEGFAPAGVTLATSLEADPVRVSGSRVALRHAPSALDGALIVDGRAPESAHESLLHVAAAGRLGIAVGDTVDVPGGGITVVGTWRPADPGDPRWAGDPLALRGSDGGVAGPLLVSRDALLALPGTPLVVWSVVPDLTGIDATGFAALAAGAARAKDLASAADETGRGVTVTGALGDRLAEAADGWADARRLGGVPLAVAWTIAVVALGQAGRVAAASREAETRLLLARGASAKQLSRLGAAEAAAVALTGTMLGGGVAILTLRGLTGSWAQTPDAAAWSGVAGLTALVAISWATAAGSADLARRPVPGRARAAALGGAAVLVLVAAAAAVATWRLSRAGVLPVADAWWDADRLAVLAPAALLTLAAAAAPVLLRPALALAQRAAPASRGVEAWLAGAHVTRAMRTSAVPVALAVLAMGAVTLAAVFGGGTRAVGADLAALERGADLRAELAQPPAGGMPTLAGYGSADGVRAASPVWIEDARVGDGGVQLVSAPLDQLSQSAAMPAGASIPPSVLEAEAERDALAVPADATELSIRISGHLLLDPWQLALARQLPDLSARQAQAPYIPDPVAATQSLTLEALRDLGAPATVRAQVLVRDMATGVSRWLPIDDLTVPGLDLTWRDEVGVGPSRTASTERRVPLPPGDHAVDGVAIRVPAGPAGATLDLDIALAVDGAPLVPVGPWGSDVAVPDDAAQPYLRLSATTPVQVGMTEIPTAGDVTEVVATSTRPDLPPLLTTTAGGWHLTGEPWRLAAVRLGPDVSFTGDAPLADVPVLRPPAIPVALTAQAARTAGLQPGDAFELDAFQRRLPATLVEVVSVVPGTTQPAAALADSRAVARALAATADAIPWPDELWVAADDPADAASRMSQLAGVESVRVAPPGSDTGGLASRIFWWAAGGAVALGIAGIAATFLAQVDARRREVAVLHRLGLGGRAQARSRAVEHGALILVAALLGVVVGSVVGWISAGPLVRTATGADARWPVPTVVDLQLGAVLLSGSSLVLAVVIGAVALAVRRQAANTTECAR